MRKILYKFTNDIKKITILTLYFCTFFSITIYTTRLIIFSYFFFINGLFNFGINDIYYSIKAGISGGIPVGIGSWVLTKLENRTSDKK